MTVVCLPGREILKLVYCLIGRNGCPAPPKGYYIITLSRYVLLYRGFVDIVHIVPNQQTIRYYCNCKDNNSYTGQLLGNGGDILLQ